jgi:hypothetical protein
MNRKKIINNSLNKKITLECEKFIINKVILNPIINLNKLRNNVNDTFFINVSKNSIYRIIKKNNITYKTIQKNKYWKSDFNEKKKY